MSIRTQRIGNVIQREVSQLFAEALDEHEYGLITVTHVRVLEDLSEARIYVTALQNQEGLITMLNKRHRYIRRTIKPRLHLKKIPQFSFRLDETVTQAEEMEKLFRKE